jgi:hypothetical protein
MCTRVSVCACVRVCVFARTCVGVRQTAWFEKMCQVFAKLNSFAITKALKIVFSLIVTLVC